MTSTSDSSQTDRVRWTRRTFLRSVGLAGLSVATASLAAACAPIGTPESKPAVPAATSAPAAAAKPTEAPKPADASKPAAPVAQAPAATSAPAESKPAEAAKPAAPAAQAPAAGKAGGVLRLIQTSDVAPREPHLRLGSNGPIYLAVWDTLITYDKNVKPRPALAERFDWSSDFKTLTLKLRDGVKFHSGRPLTSEDVEFCITRIREPAVGSQMRGASMQITKIERPDTLTISLGFDKPYRAIFDMLDGMVIVDRETVGDAGGGKVIGTGPYTWKEWSPNEKAVLEKNPSYWKSGEPLLDRIEITVISDVQSMGVQFEAGAYDLALKPSAQDYGRLSKDGRFKGTVMDTGDSFYYVAADVKVPPLDKKEVRQAINYAVNRERFISTVGSGISEPANLPWPNGSPAFDAAQNSTVKFDLDKAKALLAQAGVGSGLELPITFNTQVTATNGKLAELLQADLATIGVKLTIKSLENTVFQQTLNEAKFGGLFTHGHGFSNESPEALFVQAFPFRKQNASNFTSPDFARLADAMQDETDPAKLKAIYSDMNKLLLDESFIMDVATNPAYFLTRQNVQNVDFTLIDWMNFNRTTVS
jgi:peptide/nickel transport system substrate-binding protein